MLIVFILGFGLTSCKAPAPPSQKVTYTDPNALVSSDPLDISVDVSTLPSDINEATFSRESGRLSLAQVQSGGFIGLGILEGGIPATQLKCVIRGHSFNQPFRARIYQHYVFLEFTQESEGRNLTIPCSTSRQKFEIYFQVKAGRYDLISRASMESATTRQAVSDPHLSATGEFAVWVNRASTRSSFGEILWKDITTGEVRTVSLTSSGLRGNRNFRRPMVTQNGRYVFFESDSTNLLSESGALPSGKYQVYMKDLQTGAVELISSRTGTIQNAGTEDSFLLDIVPSGNKVLITSTSNNMITGGLNGAYQIFVRDRTNGTMILASSVDGTISGQGSTDSRRGRISGNGNFVFFSTEANQTLCDGASYPAGTVSGIIYNGTADSCMSIVTIFRKNLTSKVLEPANGLVNGPGFYYGRTYDHRFLVSDDGRYLAIHSWDSNYLMSGLDSRDKVFRIDMNDFTFSRVVLVSSSDGTGSGAFGDSSLVGMSADGRYITFATRSNVGYGVSSTNDMVLYRKDLVTNSIPIMSPNRTTLSGLPTDSNLNGCMYSNGVGNATCSESNLDASIHLILTGTSDSVTDSLLGGAGQGLVLYANGKYQTLTSGAVSGGSTANGESHVPSSSADGRYVSFYSRSTNLISGASGQYFLKDRRTGQLSILSSLDGSMTSAARILNAGNVVSHNLPLRGLESDQVGKLSADGKKFIFVFPPYTQSPLPTHDQICFGNACIQSHNQRQIFEKDLTTGQLSLVMSSGVNSGVNFTIWGVRLSSNLRYFTFLANDGTYDQLYVLDRNAGTMSQVSRVGLAGASGNGDSLVGHVCNDGSFVAYATEAVNLRGTGSRSVILKEMATGNSTRISVNATADNSGYSWGPVISSDCRYVVFSSSDNLLGNVFGPELYRWDRTTQSLSLVSSPDGITAFQAGNNQWNDHSRYRLSDDGNFLFMLVSVSSSFYTDSYLNLSYLGQSYGPRSYVLRKDIANGELRFVSGVSVPNSPDALAFGNYQSIDDFDITGDGRYLTLASDYFLVNGASGRQVYIRDLQNSD